MQLGAWGIQKLRLLACDTVELPNFTTQGYRHSDLGLAKILATKSAVHEIDATIEVTMIRDRFRPPHCI